MFCSAERLNGRYLGKSRCFEFWEFDVRQFTGNRSLLFRVLGRPNHLDIDPAPILLLQREASQGRSINGWRQLDFPIHVARLLW